MLCLQCSHHARLRKAALIAVNIGWSLSYAGHSFNLFLSSFHTHILSCLQSHSLAASPVKTIYGVGDNPLTDILGANNAGKHWRSALVRTGMFQGPGNDKANPAHIVEDDILSVVKRVLKEHGVTA